MSDEINVIDFKSRLKVNTDVIAPVAQPAGESDADWEARKVDLLKMLNDTIEDVKADKVATIAVVVVDGKYRPSTVYYLPDQGTVHAHNALTTGAARLCSRLANEGWEVPTDANGNRLPD